MFTAASETSLLLRACRDRLHPSGYKGTETSTYSKNSGISPGVSRIKGGTDVVFLIHS